MVDQTNHQNREDYTKVDPRLAGGIVSINAFKQNNSSARVSMDSSHMSQAIVLEHAEPIAIGTGAEYNFADYLFDVRINGEEGEEVRILAILKKYSRTGGENNIEVNPTTYVIYENLTTGIIDMSVVPSYHFHHTFFGFKYRFTKRFESLQVGQIHPCQAILATTPNYDADNHIYKFGINAKVALGSFPGGIEDGFVISESFAEKLTAKHYTTLTVNYGETDFLLNLYGDEENYKAFPDIGDYVRPDGLVFASRKLSPTHAITRMTPHSLRDPDPIFDTCAYGVPGGKVVDITVHHGHDTSTWYLPTGMKKQPHKYYDNYRKFGRDLESFYFSLKKTKGARPPLSPDLHRLITEIMKTDHKRLRRSNRVTYRKEDLKQYRVTITIEKDYKAERGTKLASTHGSFKLATYLEVKSYKCALVLFFKQKKTFRYIA